LPPRRFLLAFPSFHLLSLYGARLPGGSVGNLACMALPGSLISPKYVWSLRRRAGIAALQGRLANLSSHGIRGAHHYAEGNRIL
jgi:hypothetical protein